LEVIVSNANNKQQNKALLRRLPWWQRAAARAKSVAALAIIFSTLWVRGGAEEAALVLAGPAAW
jgi:hypothetical protein